MTIRNLFIAAFVSITTLCVAQTTDYSKFNKKFNFYIANDLGRNGYYDQKPIAETMGVMADEIGPEFVIATGDIHHYDGVRSINDPLWLTSFEWVYSHPELMIDWYAVLGNHEYRGNSQAVLDYREVSRRWSMPDRYYTKTFKHKDNTTLRVIWLDTTPLISKYHNDSDTYPDVARENPQRQLAWVDSVLNAANEDWIIVAGHHPMYADTSKDASERTELQQSLNPILKKHGVDMYIAGHIHNFQHIRMPDSDIDYIVNSSGTTSRKAKPIEGTQFCDSNTGFSIASLDKKELNLYMIDKNGKILYTVRRTKK